jgi:maltooligosyltrehalose trehalohydrolase
MTRSEDGWFTAEAEAPPGTRYRFRLPDGLAIPDPASRAQQDSVHGWSLLVDQDSYQWRTPDWAGRPWEESVIYELHAGLLGGFAGVADHLPRLKDLGVTAVELMPVNAFGGERNWGYDGVLPYAPASAYGTPDALKALVDRAHQLGLRILLDVVYNHFGPDGNYLAAYAPAFFDDEVDTPWGAAIAHHREPVRRFFIDNALMWLEEYRFDGLRLDAVHAIQDPSFLDFLSEEVRTRIPGRHVHLILENEHNDAARLDGGYDAQWNDDFHNSIHVLLTGESEGYYRGFADKPAEHLARVLGEGFAYQGELPPGAAKPRGSPSGHLRAAAFVSFLQNHDQIGNRAFGERLTALIPSDKLRAATALLLLCPQIPLIFMGDEMGSTSPFLFFTDFRDELAQAVRTGRRGEFAHFSDFSDPAIRETIPDPNDPATFEASRPQPGREAAEWEALYGDLLALRHREIVPRLKGAVPTGAEAVGKCAVIAGWRMGDGAHLSLFLNVGEDRRLPAHLPESDPIYAIGTLGAPCSFAAWLEEAR